MDDRTLFIALRLVHILAGVFWVGAALLLNFFVGPTVRQAGPEGGRFMQQLMVARRLATWLSLAAGLTVLSGIVMYGRISVLTGGAFADTPHGLALAVGGLSALAAGIVGATVGGAAGRRMAAIGTRLQAATAPPDPSVTAELRRLGRRAALGGGISVALLVLATGSMAVARYL
ncbi:MAG: hypothetical protein ACYC2G_14470 [Gemmatimonadaceae bacterium]